MSDPRPFFLEGRRCPDYTFVATIAWRLRAMGLEADATFIEALDRDDPRIASLFAISNAEREQERGAGFTPGPCQLEHMARLKEVGHKPSKALDGLIAAGIEDMARAHAAQLRAKPKRTVGEPKRSDKRRTAARVRPIGHQRKATA